MKGKKTAGDDFERGSWVKKPKMPDQWIINYKYKQMNLNFRLGLTAFGHIGVFPEQAINWNYVYDLVSQNAKSKEQNANGKNEGSPAHPLTRSPCYGPALTPSPTSASLNPPLRSLMRFMRRQCKTGMTPS